MNGTAQATCTFNKVTLVGDLDGQTVDVQVDQTGGLFQQFSLPYTMDTPFTGGMVHMEWTTLLPINRPAVSATGTIVMPAGAPHAGETFCGASGNISETDPAKHRRPRQPGLHARDAVGRPDLPGRRARRPHQRLRGRLRAIARSGGAEARLVARRLAAQQIARRAFATPAALVGWMGAVQAQDALGARWAVGLRLSGRAGDEAVDATVLRALAEGSILRTHVMRLDLAARHAGRSALDVVAGDARARRAGGAAAPRARARRAHIPA